MFDDFISGLSGLFGGGDSGGGEGINPSMGAQAAGGMRDEIMRRYNPTTGTMDPVGTSTGGFMPMPNQDSGNLLTSLLLGVGAPILGKLMGGSTDKDISKSLKNIRGTANTATGAGKTLLDRASKGQLTDPQQARVDAMKAEQKARYNQYMASLGIPVSTAMVQGQNEVDMKAQAFANDLINQSFDQGIKALGLGGASSTQLLQSAMAQKADMAKTISEVAKQLGLIFNTNPGKEPGGAQTNVPQDFLENWTDPNAGEGDYSFMDPFLE